MGQHLPHPINCLPGARYRRWLVRNERKYTNGKSLMSYLSAQWEIGFATTDIFGVETPREDDRTKLKSVEGTTEHSMNGGS